MASDFKVILLVRQHFGDSPTHLTDVEPGLPFVGQQQDYPFDCPSVDAGETAVLMFQSRDVDHARNVIHINPAEREQPTVYGGIPVSPSKNEWNGNIAFIRPGVLKKTDNVLHIESRNKNGGLDGELDDFIIDNVVVLYKTAFSLGASTPHGGSPDATSRV